MLVTQMDVFNRLLGHDRRSTLAQFGWALVPAVALLVLWELGKLVVRTADARRERSAAGRGAPAAAGGRVRPRDPEPARPVLTAGPRR